MIRNPIDISNRVSAELASLIETVINKLETDEPVTLGAVHSFLNHEVPASLHEAEEMHHFDIEESLIDELDELIEEFGESAAAIDFVYSFASEPLSRVIEEVINDDSRQNPSSLSAVREAILAGLSGRLVGEGVLEDEDDDQLLPEIDSLIERYGADAPAEEFLRYE